MLQSETMYVLAALDSKEMYSSTGLLSLCMI